jgi:hypothetical protein
MPYTVIIGKGRLPAQAIGNRRLRVLVQNQVEGYSNAKFKRDKTSIISNILDAVQEQCPEGAFVQFDGRSWWEISDSKAREKIAATFRDCLHDQYKSSTKSKVAKRRARKAASTSMMVDSPPSSCCLSNAEEIENRRPQRRSSFLLLISEAEKLLLRDTAEFRPLGSFDPTVFDSPIEVSIPPGLCDDSSSSGLSDSVSSNDDLDVFTLEEYEADKALSLQ